MYLNFIILFINLLFFTGSYGGMNTMGYGGMYYMSYGGMYDMSYGGMYDMSYGGMNTLGYDGVYASLAGDEGKIIRFERDKEKLKMKNAYLSLFFSIVGLLSSV